MAAPSVRQCGLTEQHRCVNRFSSGPAAGNAQWQARGWLDAVRWPGSCSGFWVCRLPAPGARPPLRLLLLSSVVADASPCMRAAQQPGVGHRPDPRCRALGGDGLSTARLRCPCLPVGLALLGVGARCRLPWGDPRQLNSGSPRRRSRLAATAGLASPFARLERCSPSWSDGRQSADALELLP